MRTLGKHGLFAPEPPVDDLSTSRGVVLSRAATILRSIETQPLTGGSLGREVYGGRDTPSRIRMTEKVVVAWTGCISHICVCVFCCSYLTFWRCSSCILREAGLLLLATQQRPKNVLKKSGFHSAAMTAHFTAESRYSYKSM